MNCQFGANKFTGNVLFPSKQYRIASSSTQVIFSYSVNFNGRVQLPNGMMNCALVFNNCANFNSTVMLPNTANYCYGTFQYCRNFNQPVNIPPFVTNTYSMFYNCSAMNSRVTFASDKDLIEKITVYLKNIIVTPYRYHSY